MWLGCCVSCVFAGGGSFVGWGLVFDGLFLCGAFAAVVSVLVLLCGVAFVFTR